MRNFFENYILAFGWVAAVILFAIAGFSEASQNTSINSKSSVSATAESGGVSVSGEVSGPINVESGDASASVDAVIITNGENSSVKAEAKAEANGEKAEVKKELDGTTDGNANFKETVENGGAKATVEVSQNSGSGEENSQEEAKHIAETERKGIIARINNTVVSAVKNIFEKIFDFFS